MTNAQRDHVETQRDHEVVELVDAVANLIGDIASKLSPGDHATRKQGYRVANDLDEFATTLRKSLYTVELSPKKLSGPQAVAVQKALNEILD